MTMLPLEGFQLGKNKMACYIKKRRADERTFRAKLTFAMDLSEIIMFTCMLKPLLLSPHCTYITPFYRIKKAIRNCKWCVLAKYNLSHICSIGLSYIAYGQE